MNFNLQSVDLAPFDNGYLANIAEQLNITGSGTAFCQEIPSLLIMLKNAVETINGDACVMLDEVLPSLENQQKQFSMGVPLENELNQSINFIRTQFSILTAVTKHLMKYVFQLNSISKQLEKMYPGSTIQEKTTIEEFFQNLLAVYRSLLQRSILVIQHPEGFIKKESKFNTEIQLLADVSVAEGAAVQVRIITLEDAQSLKTGALTCKEIASAADVSYNLGKLKNSGGNLISHFAKKPILNKILYRPAHEGGKVVTEQKYVILYEISPSAIMQQKLGYGDNIWAVSLPVVLISAANQQIAASGTILWDRMFGDENAADWAEFCWLLNIAFKHLSGAQKRDLSANDLAYFRQKLRIAPTDSVVTFQCFAKVRFAKGIGIAQRSLIFQDNISQVEREKFSFWTWFESVARLMSTRVLLPLWEKGYIMGFSSKEELGGKICNSNQAVFVLRFSDNYLGTFTVSTFRCNMSGLIEHVPYVIENEQLELADSSVALLKKVEEIRNIRFICAADFSQIDKSVIFSDPELSVERGNNGTDQHLLFGYFKLKAVTTLKSTSVEETSDEQGQENACCSDTFSVTDEDLTMINDIINAMETDEHLCP